MRRSTILVFSLLIFLLSGCSSVQPDTYYVLPMSASNVAKKAREDQPLLVVLPVIVAPLIANRGLVYQTSPTTMVQAQHNLWAGNIGKQLTYRIVQDLRVKQSAYWVTALSTLLNATQSMHLQVKISAFYGQYTGNAIVRGEWFLFHKDDTLYKTNAFEYVLPIQTANYNGQVESLSNGLDQLTQNIAQNLR